MIQLARVKQVMLSRLEAYTGCTVVPSNTTKQMPTYPFISYSIINTDTHKGTYGAYTEQREVDGVNTTVNLLTMPVRQTWSFTVQSNSDDEALEKALMIKDFFEEKARLALADNDIIVADVGAIVPRDNLITIEYEYRKGLDVAIRLNNVVEDSTDTIETVTINHEIYLEKE